MYPGKPFDEIWQSQKDQLKVKRISVRWKTAIQKVKPKIPEKLASIKEIWRYFLNHTSFHGLPYWLDKKLHPFERIFWVLVFLIGFCWSIKIILQIYNEFQTRKSNIIIDDVNKDIQEVPFPSITVCPPTRVDWVKALEVADELIPKGNEKAKQHFLELLERSSDITLQSLQKLHVYTNDSTELQILNDINITQVMLNVLPECETFIFNCSWKFVNQSCCDMFEVQRSVFGFCYSFNSLTSQKSKDKIPRVTHSFGLRSGLKFSTVLTNQSRLPPSMKALDHINMPIMISDVRTMPSKVRYFVFGQNYYVSLKFTCSIASAEILSLENETDPPCKYNYGHYKYENCLLNCYQMILLKKCNCTPPIFFSPSVNEQFRTCNVSDMTCIAPLKNDAGEFEKWKIAKRECKCYNECEFISYDDFIRASPSNREDNILIDIHFNGPTGICYKREIVVSTLNMLVQFGGIFGLFVGGSVISSLELLYTIFLTISCLVCCKFSYFNKREKRKIRPVIEVN